MKNIKKLTRRGLSMFLTLVMCLSMVQTSAFAAEGGPGIADGQITEPATEAPAPNYATQADLDAVFEKVGAVLEEGGVEGGIAALDQYIAVYYSLSPEDQEANAEALEAALAYQETLKAAKEAEEKGEEFENPDIDTLAYVTYKSTITFYPGDGQPTGVNMKVGDHYDGNWYVKSISTSEVTFGSQYGEHNNSFTIPAPEAIWKGVSHDYKTVAAYPTAFDGDKAIGASARLIYTGGHATFKNVINVPSSNPDPVPSGPYVKVIHKYYTNGNYDGGFEESVSVSGYYAYASDYYKPTYGGNTYTDKSYNQYLINLRGDGEQGTFILTYKRTVQVAQNYTYRLTWDYNGGKVGSDTSRTKTETTQSGTHTFYEDAQDYGYPRPIRDGFSFVGWDYAGTGTFNVSNGQINMTGIAGSTVSGTLKAKWRQNTPTATELLTVKKVFAGLNEIPKNFSIEWKETHGATGDVAVKTLTYGNAEVDESTMTLTWKVPHYYNTSTSVPKPTHKATITENCDVEGYIYVTTVEGSAWTVDGHNVTRNINDNISGTTLTITNTYSPETTVPTDPGTQQGSFRVNKSFAGLDTGVVAPEVALTYTAYRTKDGEKVAGSEETGQVTLAKNNDGTYSGIINPTVWSFDTSQTGEDVRNRYKNVIEITEDLSSAMVDGYTHKSFSALYPADGSNNGNNTVKFVLDGGTFQKMLSVKNTYEENAVLPPEPEKNPNLSITKAADETNVEVGETVTYTITVKNTGDATATNVKIVDVLDMEYLKWQGASYSWTAPYVPGPYDDPDMIYSNEAGTNIYSSMPADSMYEITHEMRPGAELTLTITAKAIKAGTVENTATVTGEDIPDVPSNKVDVTVTEPTKPVYTYTLTYHANADGEDEKVADMPTPNPVKEENTTVTSHTFTVSTNPTRNGYTFTGWNTEKDGSGTAYSAGAEITATTDNKDLHLYAQWKKQSKSVAYTVVHEYYTNDTKDEDLTYEENKTGNVGDKVAVESLDKKLTAGGNSYIYTSASIDPLELKEEPSENVITLRYNRKETQPEYTVTVKYVDENGTEIKDTVTVSTTDGGKYDVTDKKVEIDNYTFKEVQGEKALEGVINKDMEIVLVYTNKEDNPDPDEPEKKDTTYTVVHEYYTNGTKEENLTITESKTGKVGYTVTAESLDKKLTAGGNSYIYVSASPNSLELKENISENVITLRYDRKETQLEYTVTVKYVDESGAEIDESVTVLTTDGGKYDVTDKKVEIDNYTFKEVQDKKALEGVINEDIEIVLVYTKKEDNPDPDEPEKKDTTYTVVHEYYTNGKKDGVTDKTVTGVKVGDLVKAEDIEKVLTYQGNKYTYTSAAPESLTITESGNRIVLRYDRTGTEKPEEKEIQYRVAYYWNRNAEDTGRFMTTDPETITIASTSDAKRESLLDLADQKQLFDVTDEEPERDGYQFEGWTLVRAGSPEDAEQKGIETEKVGSPVSWRVGDDLKAVREVRDYFYELSFYALWSKVPENPDTPVTPTPKPDPDTPVTPTPGPDPDTQVTPTPTPEPIIPERPSRPSGGSNGGGGSRGGDSGNGPGVTPETVAIETDPVPLSDMPDIPVDELIAQIDGDDVPLAGLPKTGETSSLSRMMFALSGMLLCVCGMLFKKEEEE